MLAWIGTADDDRLRAPLPERPCGCPSTRRIGCSTRATYYRDLTADEIQAPAKELGLSGYDGYCDRGLEPRPVGCCASARLAPHRRRWAGPVRELTIEDFVLRATYADVLSPTWWTTSKGYHPRRAPRSISRTRPQARLWMLGGATGVGHVPVLVNEQRKKVEARQGGARAVPRRGHLADAMVNYLMILAGRLPATRSCRGATSRRVPPGDHPFAVLRRRSMVRRRAHPLDAASPRGPPRSCRPSGTVTGSRRSHPTSRNVS